MRFRRSHAALILPVTATRALAICAISEIDGYPAAQDEQSTTIGQSGD